MRLNNASQSTSKPPRIDPQIWKSNLWIALYWSKEKKYSVALFWLLEELECQQTKMSACNAMHVYMDYIYTVYNTCVGIGKEWVQLCKIWLIIA